MAEVRASVVSVERVKLRLKGGSVKRQLTWVTFDEVRVRVAGQSDDHVMMLEPGQVEKGDTITLKVDGDRYPSSKKNGKELRYAQKMYE